MIDETNIYPEKRSVFESYAEVAVANFQKRRINAQYVPNSEKALSKVLDLIPPGATVGWGDSVTLHQVGVISKLREMKSIQLFDPFERGDDGSLVVPGPGHLELMKKAAAAEIFLTGTNAITMDGKLVSIDAIGNRVAPLLFGPKRVIVVAGANKIVRDIDEAMKRIRFAAPVNVKRHYLKHKFKGLENLPCLKTGICVDCKRPERICSYVVIVEGEQQPVGAVDYLPRIHLIIVGEELGI